MRIPEDLATKFKAMAIVLSEDTSELFQELVDLKQNNLNQKERQTLNDLLDVWEYEKTKKH